MRRQHGFVLMSYIYIAATVAFLGLFAFAKIQSSRLAACKAESAAFVAQTKAAGEEAQRKAKAENERHAKLLKETEAGYAKAKSNLSAANQRLRDANSARRFVPGDSKATDGISRTCYDSAILESALQRLTGGVSQLVDEGDQNTLRLKLSRDWAIDALK